MLRPPLGETLIASQIGFVGKSRTVAERLERDTVANITAPNRRFENEHKFAPIGAAANRTVRTQPTLVRGARPAKPPPKRVTSQRVRRGDGYGPMRVRRYTLHNTGGKMLARRRYKIQDYYLILVSARLILSDGKSELPPGLLGRFASGPSDDAKKIGNPFGRDSTSKPRGMASMRKSRCAPRIIPPLSEERTSLAFRYVAPRAK